VVVVVVVVYCFQQLSVESFLDGIWHLVYQDACCCTDGGYS
jgi:hypothetical protein